MQTEENKDELKNGTRRSRSRSKDRTDSKASADPDATCALKLRGIPWSCEDTDIYEFFEGFKVVEDSAKLEVYDDGKKSGNAIILFESIDECQRARAEKEGNQIGNRWINLTPARNSEHETYLDDPKTRPERPPLPTESDVVFCGNIGPETTEDQLREHFMQSGGVEKVRRPEGRPFAFIEFDTFENAAKAIEELGGQEIDGAGVRLGLSRPKGSRGGGSREVVTESDTCFVGNLDPSVEEEDLEEMFDEYDYSEIRMPPGKGFAFVSFEANEAAHKAMTELNGKELKGKPLRVNLAKPKAPREEGPPLEDTAGLSTFVTEENVDRAIKIRGLPFRTTPADVLKFVKENGIEGFDYLTEKDVIMEVKDGKISGFGLVIFKDEEDAEKALDLDHKEIGTRWVGVSAAEMR